MECLLTRRERLVMKLTAYALRHAEAGEIVKLRRLLARFERASERLANQAAQRIDDLRDEVNSAESRAEWALKFEREKLAKKIEAAEDAAGGLLLRIAEGETTLDDELWLLRRGLSVDGSRLRSEACPHLAMRHGNG